MHVQAYATTAYGAWAFNPYPSERSTYTYLVPIADDGAIRLSADDASAAVTVDVLGYFGTGGGARYVPMRDADPLFDTTSGTGTWVDPVRADQSRAVPVLGNFRVPYQVRAAVLSLTAPTSDRRTDLDVSPGDGSWVRTPGLSSDVVGRPNALRPPSSNTAVVPIAGSRVVNVHNQYATRMWSPASAGTSSVAGRPRGPRSRPSSATGSSTKAAVRRRPTRRGTVTRPPWPAAPAGPTAGPARRPGDGAQRGRRASQPLHADVSARSQPLGVREVTGRC